ncbi:MAG: NAD(P)H-binding protein [Chloroflexi bacterium]|nr:NAD(P)H-binding protein [Chloroflexota bacterium]
MSQVTVLGAGLVGSTIVKDLAQDTHLSVTAVDVNQQTLDKLAAEVPVKGIQANLQDTDTISALISDCDLVVCAVPGSIGFETVKTIIKTGKNVVDISFFEEDPFLLDELAKTNNVTAVVDCGVAPGLCNILAGYVDNLFDQTDRYICYVGGLPQVRRWPYEYKASWSPSDVLEMYTRPAHLVEHGQKVVRPALSGIELIDLPGVDTLEAFNTDGLRSLGETMSIPFMKEKTLRYPGHANLMRIFRDSGFFNAAPILVDDQRISPLALTSSLIFDQWKLEEGEADFTVMRVIIEGQKEGARFCYTYDLLDKYDRETGATSMARTTGYTCTIIARQVLNGLFTRQGICPPEFIGRTEGCYENLMSEYTRRNIQLTETITTHDSLELEV